MDNFKLSYAKITKGKLFPFLKDISLCGRVDENGDFIIFGCNVKDESKFYEGILAIDKENPVEEFETVEDVKRFWTEIGDMLLYVDMSDFEIIEELTAKEKAVLLNSDCKCTNCADYEKCTFRLEEAGTESCSSWNEIYNKL